MAVGFVCGASIRYGPSYGLLVFVSAIFFYLELKRCTQRSFQWAMESFVLSEAGEPYTPPSSASLATILH